MKRDACRPIFIANAYRPIIYYAADKFVRVGNRTSIFTGLSAGLTLDPQGHGNRLIVCANHDGPDKDTRNKNHGRYSSSIYSDDAGATNRAVYCSPVSVSC